jgi:hypothetical protein
MKVKYKVLHYRPEAEWISVEFWDADNPDAEPWCHSFEFPDFSKEKLTDQLRAVASRFAGSWSRIPDHPSELTIPEEGTLDVEPEKYLTYEPSHQMEEPPPEWDMFTQQLESAEITDPEQEIIPWVVRDLTEEEIEARLLEYTFATKQERNILLLESDFINFPDACVLNVQEWLEYRQALRDVPQQAGFPKEINWPERPEVVKESLE